MDDNHNDLDNFDIEDLIETLDEMFPKGHVVLPDGAALCLCGRDPGAGTVIREIAKAVALLLEFDLCLGGCIRNAAAAYDNIHKGLKTGQATQLCQSMIEARAVLEAHFQDQPGSQDLIDADMTRPH